MNKKVRILFLIFLIVAQLAIYLYYPVWRLNVDLWFLIIIYVCLRADYLKSMLVAALLGLITDYFSGGVLGVFSFSRTLAAYFLLAISRFIDLRKNIFIFSLIFVALFMSNLVASAFFSFVFGFRITRQLILIQPFFTALIGTALVGPVRMKKWLNVY